MTVSLGWFLLEQSTVLEALSQAGSPWAMLFKWIKCSLHRVVGRAWSQLVVVASHTWELLLHTTVFSTKGLFPSNPKG